MDDIALAIRRNRTANVTVTLSHQGLPVAHQEIMMEQKKHKFLFGSNWAKVHWRWLMVSCQEEKKNWPSCATNVFYGYLTRLHYLFIGRGLNLSVDNYKPSVFSTLPAGMWIIIVS